MVLPHCAASSVFRQNGPGPVGIDSDLIERRAEVLRNEPTLLSVSARVIKTPSPISVVTLPVLLAEYERALTYTNDLWTDLSQDEVCWRPDDDASAIGWHLGHQAAVAHFMVRNLTAAEPPIDPALDRLMDSATPPPLRGDLPDLHRIATYRSEVADRVRFRVGNINDGTVGAPAQLRMIATTMLTAIINHEYQHSKWIGEVRVDQFGHALPAPPASDLLTELDGYVILR